MSDVISHHSQWWEGTPLGQPFLIIISWRRTRNVLSLGSDYPVSFPFAAPAKPISNVVCVFVCTQACVCACVCTLLGFCIRAERISEQRGHKVIAMGFGLHYNNCYCSNYCSYARVIRYQRFIPCVR